MNKTKNKNNKKLLISLSGYAGVGKNLFASLLSQYLKTNYSLSCAEASFAEDLRKELGPVVKKHFNLNTWTSDQEEKSLLRPLMVSWAHIKREQTIGLYWINKTVPKIEKAFKTNDIVIITDCRFASYPYDELNFAKENGVLVYISKFTTENGEAIFTQAPNETEKANTPKIALQSDYSVSWPDNQKSAYNIDLLSYVKDFVDWLIDQKLLWI